jgi:hypothetical protein
MPAPGIPLGKDLPKTGVTKRAALQDGANISACI